MRRCDRIRLAAATSFTAGEVGALDQLFRMLLRGGRPSARFVLTPEIASVARKVVTMKARIKAQQDVREGLAGVIGTEDPARVGEVRR